MTCRFVATRLVLAEGPLLDRILDFTYPIWNEGLTRAAYGRWNGAQLLTPWGRDHLHRFALLDEQDRLLASAKRYRFDVRLDGRDVRMSGLGAVFTPPDLRGRGYASQLVEQLVEQERQEGAAMASLFSEIGEPFYRRLGFTLVPLEEVTLEVIQKGGAPAMLVRAGDGAGSAGHRGDARDPIGSRPLRAAARPRADSLRAVEKASPGWSRPARAAPHGVLRRGGRRVGRRVCRHHSERRRMDARGSRRSRSRRRTPRGHAAGVARARARRCARRSSAHGGPMGSRCRHRCASPSASPRETCS